MSDSKEKSDDLIAELARLMASNAQGSEPAPKPSVIKLPPLGEASVPSPGPLRIPGMDAGRPVSAAPAPTPAVAPVSVSPAVRIPGMEKPAGISDPAPAATAPRPASHIDFGKPPAAAPAMTSEPLVNWQSHQASATAAPAPVQPGYGAEPRPAVVATPASFTPAPVSRAEVSTPQSPMPGSRPEEKQGDADGGFNFDFGFGAKGGGRSADAPSDDPIADLIAAELDAADTRPEPQRAEPMNHPAPVSERPTQVATYRPAPAPVAAKPATPARSSESDRFTVAPVFRSESKVPTPVPVHSISQLTARQREELDPIDEIESLIGEAVRVELAASPDKQGQPPQPAPVVPPLSTGFAPRRAGIRDSVNHAQSAEDAILAAAAASGADVGRIDTPEADDRPYKRMKVRPPKTSFVPGGARQYVGIAVAGTLLLASGFGLYWVLGMGSGGDPATAPVLTADAAPAKVEPAVTPNLGAAEPSGSVVFNEIENASTEGESIETLVSRDETAGASATEVARAVAPAAEQTSTETGLANRKVRTVTVRPDGTIVSADDAVAATEALPVERPNVPQIAGETIEPSDLLTAVAESQASEELAADPLAALVSETGDATTAPLAEPAPLEVAALAEEDGVQPVFDGSLVAPIPMPRPTNRAALAGGSEFAGVPAATLAVNQPAATPLISVTQGAGAPAASTPRGGAYVQLASLPSEGDALAQARAQASRFGGLFNGTSLEVRRVDLGVKGVWYRVVLPVSSFQEATQTCATIKANGGDCIPNNG